jgi:glycosyltransferase involved in cell wall biosynthesis
MKILLLGSDPTVFSQSSKTDGDTRTRLTEYARNLRERYREPTELKYVCYTPRSDNRTEERLEFGLSLYPTNSAHRAFFTWDAFRVARRIVADWKPDIISPQNLDEDGWVGWLFARLTGAAFVPQIHIDVFSDHWVRESWLNIPRRLSARFLLRQADLVRAVSQVLKRRIMREQHMESSRIGVVPVYVNFQPVPSGNAKALYKNRIAPGLADKPIVLFVGRLVPQKNLFGWLEVCRGIAQELPDCRFVLAGDGFLKEELHAAATNLGISGQTHFLGKVAYRDLGEIYAAADVFLLSSHYEGFGRVVLESMLSGVPVVGTACTGPEDLIDDGKDGYLLPVGDHDGLLDRTLRLLRSPELARQFGSLGREKALRKWSMQVLINDLISLWEAARKAKGNRAHAIA